MIDKQKRLLLSTVHRRIYLTDILGRAHVAHGPPSLSHNNAASMPSLYCNERLGANGAIIPLASPLPTCAVCTTSTAELDREYRQFMRGVKLPAIDYYSGGGGGMVGAKGFFQHEHAVEMEPRACETLKYAL